MSLIEKPCFHGVVLPQMRMQGDILVSLLIDNLPLRPRASVRVLAHPGAGPDSPWVGQETAETFGPNTKPSPAR